MLLEHVKHAVNVAVQNYNQQSMRIRRGGNIIDTISRCISIRIDYNPTEYANAICRHG